MYVEHSAWLYLALLNVVVCFPFCPWPFWCFLFFVFFFSLPSKRSPKKWPSLQQPPLKDWWWRCFKPSKINTSWMLSWNLADVNWIVSVDTGSFYVPFSFDSLDVLWVRQEIWPRFFRQKHLRRALPPLHLRAGALWIVLLLRILHWHFPPTPMHSSYRVRWAVQSNRPNLENLKRGTLWIFWAS